MPYFSEIEPLYTCLKELFKELMSDPVILKKSLDTNLLVKFVYRDPAGEVWIDCRGDDEVVVVGGPLGEDAAPNATMEMETDTAHLFWLGKLNLIKALASEQIIASGSIPKVMQLLPVIKPAFAIYPEVLKANNLAELADV